MPGYGEMGIQTPGTAFHPSPSVFRDCPWSELVDQGVGNVLYDDFIVSNLNANNATTLSFWNSGSTNSGGYTLLNQGTANHAVVLTTGGTNGNFTAFWGNPGATIIPSSGQRFWFEANIAEASTAAIRSIFIGLVSAGGLVSNFISGSGTLTALTTLTSTCSFVGFLSDGVAGGTRGLTQFATVYQNVTAGTLGIQNIATSILTTGTNDNPGNPEAIPAAVFGPLTPNGFVKLGMRYDGQGTIEFYVQGNLQSRWASVGLADNTVSYGPIVAVTTGATATASVTVDWVKYAYEYGGLSALVS